MSETKQPSANDPFVNVASDEYDGRPFTHEDNAENVSHYVGVDPIYQNYANEGEKPYPFTSEELDAAARRGGLDPDEDFEEEGDNSDEAPKESAKQSATLKAPPTPRTTSSKASETK